MSILYYLDGYIFGLQITDRIIPLAEGIKGMVKVPVIGVGNITEPEYADTIVREQRVDLVAFGRRLLPNPEFPKQAAQKLGMKL